MKWYRIDAIEAMSPVDRRALVERLAWELVQPGGMSKRDGIPHTPSVPVPFVPVKRPRKTVQHGTVSGYTYGRCRCDDCRDAKAAYQRENAEKLSRERLTHFEPIRKPSPVSMPFERRPISDLDAVRARAAEGWQ